MPVTEENDANGLEETEEQMETMAWISESPLPSDLRFSDTPVKSNASALSLMVA